jgi:hypothetical protein
MNTQKWAEEIVTGFRSSTQTKRIRMRLYLFIPSTRVLAIIALKNYLALDCEIAAIDLGRGDQLAPEYRVLNR